MKSNIMSPEDLYAVDFMQGGTLTGLNNITTWMFALLFPSKSALWLLDNVMSFSYLPVDLRNCDLSDAIRAMNIF
jgi:hypothetical protein